MARQRQTLEIDQIIVKGNFGWAWPMWVWPMWAMPFIAEIDCIVIREVQYQFEVNRCRNEEIIAKGNFGWAWPMWPGRPRVGNGAMHKAQYQFEVNRCRNKEVNFQGSSANSVGGAGGQDGQTDAHHHNIPTFSSKNVGTKIVTSPKEKKHTRFL
ncbi:hypothetical protein DPMN_045197 [Dreissena polymorpha]|uniref:Uncharacterized protein n=1 Tax=Dreissena polymorpha TaxID=45954 RepID=A0A9D4D5X2_DREPO|nr:hypothetical protein DPMN_045197 [Dreissena polymorpha]